MALMNEYPILTQELGQLNDGYGTMTPYNAALPNNGARNPLGALTFVNSPSQNGVALATSNGYGSGLWMKYVLYKSTGNPAVKTGPAVVYWTDETFTTVSGAFADGVVASNSASVAGWLLPNSGTVSGYGAGTTLFTATLLNNGGNGSYVWIGLQGFIPKAFSGSATAGQALWASGDFAVTGISQGSNMTHNIAGIALAAASSNVGDILATCPVF